MKTECWSCLHYETQVHVSDEGISYTGICSKDGDIAVKRCKGFVYEPGTDESERNSD